MRYFSFHEYDGTSGWIETVSEDEIEKEYYPYWYNMMIKKYGKTIVDKTFSFEDCLEDWKITYWAWEVHE